MENTSVATWLTDGLQTIWTNLASMASWFLNTRFNWGFISISPFEIFSTTFIIIILGLTIKNLIA